MVVGVAGVRGRGSVTPDLLLVSPPTVAERRVWLSFIIQIHSQQITH